MPVENPSPTGNIFLDAFFEPNIDPNYIPPTGQINGSGSGTAYPDGVGDPNVPTTAERADALFPFFDGVNARLSTNPISQDGLTEYLFPGRSPTMTPSQDANGNPLTPEQLFAFTVDIVFPTSGTDVTVEDFFGFHSSHQLEYVLNSDDPVPGFSDARMVTFGEGANRIDVVAIPGERRVFVLQQLTKTDLAIIAPDTEEVLAAALGTLPAALREEIESAVGASVGLASDDALNGLITNARAAVNGFFTRTGAQNFTPDQIAGFRDVFTDQIDNIEARAAQASFFDLLEIRTRIDEIVRRADRANEFFIVAQTPPSPLGPVTITNPGFPPFVPPFDETFPRSDQDVNVNAPVGADLSQSGILEGFNTFIAQETRIRDLDNQRLQLANSGVLNGGRALDGPNLIAIFQLNYNLTREAEVNLETEELNQQNALLQIYSAVQQLVNDALRAFGTGEDGANEERTIAGVEGDQTYSSLPEEDRNLIAFVEDFLVLRSDVGHPIETLRNINRPTLDIIANRDGTLNRFSQNELNIFASQLADTVTQINQESQILTNEISSINRERNRNFDLANNALRRLNDSLLTIARA